MSNIFLEAKNNISNSGKIRGRYKGSRSVNNKYQRETTSFYCQFVFSLDWPIGTWMSRILLLFSTTHMEQEIPICHTSTCSISFVSCMLI